MLISGVIQKFIKPAPQGLYRADALAMLRSGECRVMIRVEDRKGKPGRRGGAYFTGAIERCIYTPAGVGMDDLLDKHPGPMNDAGLAYHWYELGKDKAFYKFGFNKFSQYKNWFFLEDPLKAEEEYSVLGVYIASREYSHVGQFQMIAHDEEMIHLMDLPLTYKLDATLQELYDAQEKA